MKPVLNWDTIPVLLDIPYVVRILGISNEIVRKQFSNGTLPGFKVDGRQCDGVKLFRTNKTTKIYTSVNQATFIFESHLFLNSYGDK
jgi:hypothetical protein